VFVQGGRGRGIDARVEKSNGLLGPLRGEEMVVNRRDVLRGGMAFALLPKICAGAATDGGSFTFAHFTDIHILPERKAPEGSAKCFEKMNALQPDFALCGGDLVFDSNETPRPKGIELFDLYQSTAKRVTVPVHSVPGNHDVFGLSNKSGVAASDPLYGKKMFEDRIGKRYSTFAHKGWHFVLLDSIGTTPDRTFIGMVDEEQLGWLAETLKPIGTTAPIVVMTHVPVVSAVMQIVPDPWKTPQTYVLQNSIDVLKILAPYNVKMVLQGHTHIREEVIYNGCRFITSGAVCGNWWKGPRLGNPEGFAMLTVKGDNISWRYETYGFVATPEAAALTTM
jgi:Icc protein